MKASKEIKTFLKKERWELQLRLDKYLADLQFFLLWNDQLPSFDRTHFHRQLLNENLKINKAIQYHVEDCADYGLDETAWRK